MGRCLGQRRVVMDEDQQIDELLQFIREHSKVVSLCVSGCLVMLGFITIFQIKVLVVNPWYGIFAFLPVFVGTILWGFKKKKRLEIKLFELLPENKNLVYRFNWLTRQSYVDIVPAAGMVGIRRSFDTVTIAKRKSN